MNWLVVFGCLVAAVNVWVAVRKCMAGHRWEFATFRRYLDWDGIRHPSGEPLPVITKVCTRKGCKSHRTFVNHHGYWHAHDESLVPLRLGQHLTDRWLQEQNARPIPVLAKRGDVLPGDVLVDDPRLADVVSRAWNSGGIVAVQMTQDPDD